MRAGKRGHVRYTVTSRWMIAGRSRASHPLQALVTRVNTSVLHSLSGEEERPTRLELPLPDDELRHIAEVAWPVPVWPHEGLDGRPRLLLALGRQVSGGGPCQHLPGQVKGLIVKTQHLGLHLRGDPRLGQLLQKQGRI